MNWKKKAGLVLLFCLLAVSAVIIVNKSESQAATQKGTVTASKLNVRSGPGTGYSIVKVDGTNAYLLKGETCKIVKKSTDGWYEILFTFNSKTAEGYVLGDYLKIETADEPEEEEPAAGELALNSKSEKVSIGKSFDFNIKNKVSGSKYKWTSSNTKVATVNSKNGKAKGLKVGEVTISCKITLPTGKTKTLKATFKVCPDATAVAIKNPVSTMNVGESHDFNRTITPSGSANKTYWKVEKDDNVLADTRTGEGADIMKESGEFTPKEAGTYYITASCRRSKTAATLRAESEPLKVVVKDGTITEEPKEEIPVEGKTTAESLNVRKGYGTTYGKVTLNGQNVQLKKNTAVEIEGSKEVSGTVWYSISFTYSGVSMTGYVSGDYIKVTKTEAPETEEPEEEEPKEEDPEEEPEEKVPVEGKTTASSLNVRKGYGTTYGKLTLDGKNVQLKKNTVVEIEGSKIVDGTLWYKIVFTYSGEELTGCVSGDYIKVTRTETPKTEEPKEEEPEQQPPMSEAEFETYMTAQGFPESYKPYLRALHASHPTWVFEAYHTNKDWTTVIDNESTAGKNLITNSRNISYKSFDEGCYDYATDAFVLYDGTTWVTASRAAVEYCMDPRNWLRESYVYQFETLSYTGTGQTAAGVEAILANTAFGNKSFTYTDDSGQQVTMKYSEAIMEAAKYSGVSPYHLASRIKQEVVTGTQSVSGSVTGKYSGYEGYYNFYNIGAYNSAGGGAIANGLKFAKNGTTSHAKNVTYKIPWDNPYDAIVGGAYYIGSTYIQRGQNTIYLQKFNVTNTSTYSHQYMSNVEAPYSESAKVKAAYMAIGEMPLTFSIPVYLNMPEEACPSPSGAKNPNNWLAELNVAGEGVVMTPAFDVEDSEGILYTVTVPATTPVVEVQATPVADAATVKGTGMYALSGSGTSLLVSVDCTAENGEIRQYILNIIQN